VYYLYISLPIVLLDRIIHALHQVWRGWSLFLFGFGCVAVPESDNLKVLDRNPARRIMSEEDQRYVAKLLSIHVHDYSVSEVPGLMSKG